MPGYSKSMKYEQTLLRVTLTLPSYDNSAADYYEHILSKIENLYNWMDNLWLKVENIVAKGEIARFEQFILLSLCFQKAVCCRGIKKRLYEGNG